MTTTNTTQTKTVRLNANTAREARREISERWPQYEIQYKGYDVKGECVLMSTVRRQGNKAHVATAKRNRSKPSVSFDAEVPL